MGHKYANSDVFLDMNHVFTQEEFVTGKRFRAKNLYEIVLYRATSAPLRH